MISLLKNYKKYSDEKLVPLVVKGNERAFNELYGRYEKKMYRFFYRMLNRDTERANDLLKLLKKGIGLIRIENFQLGSMRWRAIFVKTNIVGSNALPIIKKK